MKKFGPASTCRDRRIAVIVPRATASVNTSAGSELGIRLGQRVHHNKFGDGVILNCEGQGAHARVQINFESEGTKWLVLGYANLDLM